MKEARLWGLKVSLDLINYWTDYTSPEDVLQMATGDVSMAGKDIRDFYSNPEAKAWYKHHVGVLLNRTNPFTGVQYRLDPTVFSWGLINEPRCPCCNETEKQMVVQWVQEMAQFVKGLAPNHLINVGTEGFFNEPFTIERDGGTQRLVGFNPGAGAECEGADYISIHSIPEVDIAVIHPYPVQFEPMPHENPNNPQWVLCGFECMMNWLQQYVTVHQHVATHILEKPLVIQEIGLSAQHFTAQQQKQWMALAANMVKHSRDNLESLAGLQFWQAKLPGQPDDDGYGVYFGEAPVPSPARRLLEVMDEPSNDEEEPEDEEELLDSPRRSLLQKAATPDFRRRSERQACAQQAGDAGWEPIFKRRGVVDLQLLSASVDGLEMANLLSASAKALLAPSSTPCPPGLSLIVGSGCKACPRGNITSCVATEVKVLEPYTQCGGENHLDCPDPSDSVCGTMTCPSGFYCKRLHQWHWTCDKSPDSPLDGTDCNPGEGYVGGTCVACQIGTYSSGGPMATCQPCPGTMTTLQANAVSIQNCTCTAGTERTEQPGNGGGSSTSNLHQGEGVGEHGRSSGTASCVPCPAGYWSYAGGSCTRCPEGQTTLKAGATSPDQCLSTTQASRASRIPLPFPRDS